MESKHTPTPWKLKDGMEIQGDSMKPIAGADGIILGFVSDKNLVDHSQRDIDAAFIVRATNHYELMVSLLKEVYSEKGASGHVKGKIEKAFDSMGEVL